MRTIPLRSLDDSPELYAELAEILRDGGLVCFPVGRHYGIAASLLDEDAVIRLVQSKRRSRRAPSLVFVPDRDALHDVVDQIPPQALPLMDAFWPGPLTILFRPAADLPSKVSRTLAKRHSDKLGVRISDEPLAHRLVEAFGGPLLITSANVARKVGSSSLAQVRKNFARVVDVVVDAGDLPACLPSTVVDPEADGSPVIREGAVPAERVLRILTPGLAEA